MSPAGRMLIRKAWLESKTRFLAAAVILTVLGLSTVLRAPATIAGWERIHRGEQMSYALYVWLSLPHGFLQFLWIIAAVLLGLGGLFVAVWIGYVPLISGGTFLPLSFVLSLATMILVGGLLVYFSKGASD